MGCPRWTLPRLLLAAFIAGGLVGAPSAWVFSTTAGNDAAQASAARSNDLAALKAAFRRPPGVPFPHSNPFSEERRTLGEKLFGDVQLSSTGSLACASCHQRDLGFADGRLKSLGADARPLARHTPTLWNLAWAARLFWDGRARSLEEQVTSPIESADEMAQSMEPLLDRLRAKPAYAQAFARAFPEDPQVTRENLIKAIATFERALVSPRTRFDRWVDGENAALSPQEIEGFRLFTGRAGCANCHAGWAFTDQAFHDIGLPGEDRGRGAVLRLEAAEHGFKTPTLRELSRSAPYMHDGSLANLEEVVRHYESGIIERPTLSPDLPRDLSLNDDEREALIAFLRTLTSEHGPQPAVPILSEPSTEPAPAARVAVVTQHDKTFSPGRVALKQGERLWVVNNDTRTHNVRIFAPARDFDSGAQEPGETVELPFPDPGAFLVFCGIHPKMELHVDVAP